MGCATRFVRIASGLVNSTAWQFGHSSRQRSSANLDRWNTTEFFASDHDNKTYVHDTSDHDYASVNDSPSVNDTPHNDSSYDYASYDYSSVVVDPTRRVDHKTGHNSPRQHCTAIFHHIDIASVIYDHASEFDIYIASHHHDINPSVIALHIHRPLHQLCRTVVGSDPIFRFCRKEHCRRTWRTQIRRYSHFFPRLCLSAVRPGDRASCIP